MAESGGTWMRADPSSSRTNWPGPASTWSPAPITIPAITAPSVSKLTTKYVEQAGLVHAGAGMSLAEAREAKFLETPKARVALISLASSFANHMRAGMSRDDVPARPGLNPLRYETTYVLPESDYENVRSAADSLGEFTDQDGNPRGTNGDSPGEMQVLGRNFAVGDEPHIRREPNEDDVAAILAVIDNASRVADFTIVTIHSHHEHGGRREIPARFPAGLRARHD